MIYAALFSFSIFVGKKSTFYNDIVDCFVANILYALIKLLLLKVI